MAAPATVDEYIAGFPPDVAERLKRIRAVIVAEVGAPAPHQGSGAGRQGKHPEEKIRYGIAAVMLDGRYALHYAGWKKHIGLYPVPVLDEPLESRVAPYRAEKDSVTFPHSAPIPYDLIGEITRAIVAGRAETQPGSD